MGHVQIADGQQSSRYERGFRQAGWNVSHGPDAATG
jgi:hypothetical protein